MSSNDTLPPRISNTPPSIDTSFDDENSNNSKSAEDFNKFHLDDSDLIVENKVDDIEIEFFRKEDRSDTLTEDKVEVEQNNEDPCVEHQRDEEEEKKIEDPFVEQKVDDPFAEHQIDEEEEKKIEDSFKFPDEDDSFNLSDDKLKTIIEDFKISSNESTTTLSNFEQQEFEETSNWDPFGGDNREENGGDWATFDAQTVENKFEVETPITSETEKQMIVEEEDDWDNFVSIENENIVLVVEDNKKNEEIYFENFLLNASKLFEKSIESEKSFYLDDSIHVDEKYLFETEYVNDAWNKLVDYKNSNSLKFVWRGSKIEEYYLNSINIDKKNINTTSRLLDKNRYTTLFSSNNILQPTKVEAKQLINNNVDLNLKSTNNDFTQSTSSFNTLDIDLSYLEAKTDQQNTKQQSTNQLLNELLSDINSIKSIPSPSSNASNSFELILTPQFSQLSSSQQQVTTTTTTITTTVIKTNIDPNRTKIGQKSIDLLDRLPNLNFMKSNVLMFPTNK